MPNEDMDVRSDAATEENKTTVPSPEQETPELEITKENASDQVNVNVETNPNSELFRRRSGPQRSLKKLDKTKGGPMDNGSDISPAILDVGELQTISLGHMNKLDILKDENSLAKGVVLNATQLYPPRDVRWVPETLSGDKAKDHELMQNYLGAGNQVMDSSQDKKDIVDDPPEMNKGEMSLARKIIFGFSFLPSVMFVLCFAVILPCEEPKHPFLCEKVLWSITLNDTDFTTNFGVADKALLIGLLEKNAEVTSWNMANGDKMWATPFNSTVTQLQCGDLDSNGDGIKDCLVMTKDGAIYTYNTSNGHVIREYSNSDASRFTVLSDCDGDGVRDVAVAVSSSEIQIINHGPVLLSNCKTTPRKLTAWSHDNVTDLVFVCETDSGIKSLLYMKQDDWCIKEKKLKTETFELLNSFRDKMDLDDIIFTPSSNGLVAWAEDFVVFFDNHGKELWQTSITNHSENRYLFIGDFVNTEKQVALLSGDPTTHSLVTLLSSSSGNETYSHSFALADTKNALTINSEKQDHILLLLKVTEKTVENSSSVESSLTTVRPTEQNGKDVFDLPEPTRSRNRLILLDFHVQDGVFSMNEKEISSVSSPNSDLNTPGKETTRLSAIVKGKNLEICRGQTLTNPLGNVSSIIQVIQVDHWNESPGTSSCK